MKTDCILDFMGEEAKPKLLDGTYVTRGSGFPQLVLQFKIYY